MKDLFEAILGNRTKLMNQATDDGLACAQRIEDLEEGCSGMSPDEKKWKAIAKNKAKKARRRKRNEGKINEWFSAGDMVEQFEETYGREALIDGGFDEESVNAMYTKLGDLITQTKNTLKAVDDYAKKNKITRDDGLPGYFPTLWLETTDAFDMAEAGDYSGFAEVFKDIIIYAKEEGILSESKLTEQDAEPLLDKPKEPGPAPRGEEPPTGEDSLPTEGESEEEPKPEVEPVGENPDEKRIVKRVIGKIGSDWFYVMHTGEEQDPDLVVADAEGKLIFSAKKNQLDPKSVLDFLIMAVREVKLDSVSADIFLDYMVPAIEKKEKEDNEYVEDEEEKDAKNQGEEGMEPETVTPEQEVGAGRREPEYTIADRKLKESEERELPDDLCYVYKINTKEKAVEYLQKGGVSDSYGVEDVLGKYSIVTDETGEAKELEDTISNLKPKRVKKITMVGIYGEEPVLNDFEVNAYQDKTGKLLVSFNSWYEMEEHDDDLPESKTNEDGNIAYRTPGDYKITFMDMSVIKIWAESQYDAKKRAAADNPGKRVLKAELVNATHKSYQTSVAAVEAKKGLLTDDNIKEIAWQLSDEKGEEERIRISDIMIRLRRMGVDVDSDYLASSKKVRSVLTAAGWELGKMKEGKVNEMSQWSRAASTDEQEKAIKKIEATLKKLGKNVVGGITIGKSPQTVILDLKHHGSEIYIDSDGRVKIHNHTVSPGNPDSVQAALGRTERAVDEPDEIDYTEEGRPNTNDNAQHEGDVGESKSLIEIKVVSDRREFEVQLKEDSPEGVVIEISGKPFRFGADFASMYRTEGKLTEEGVKGLALDALANMEDPMFNQLAAKAMRVEEQFKEGEKNFRIWYVDNEGSHLKTWQTAISVEDAKKRFLETEEGKTAKEIKSVTERRIVKEDRTEPGAPIFQEQDRDSIRQKVRQYLEKTSGPQHSELLDFHSKEENWKDTLALYKDKILRRPDIGETVETEEAPVKWDLRRLLTKAIEAVEHGNWDRVRELSGHVSEMNQADTEKFHAELDKKIMAHFQSKLAQQRESAQSFRDKILGDVQKAIKDKDWDKLKDLAKLQKFFNKMGKTKEDTAYPIWKQPCHLAGRGGFDVNKEGKIPDQSLEHPDGEEEAIKKLAEDREVCPKCKLLRVTGPDDLARADDVYCVCPDKDEDDEDDENRHGNPDDGRSCRSTGKEYTIEGQMTENNVKEETEGDRETCPGCGKLSPFGELCPACRKDECTTSDVFGEVECDPDLGTPGTPFGRPKTQKEW